MENIPHVFLVEDAVIAQVAEAAVFEELGCKVTLASTGREAIQQTREAPDYDLILLDLGLPDVDPLTVMESIFTHYDQLNKKPPPVIALTAFADKSFQAQCIQAGMTDFLAKPLTPALARTVLRKYLTK